MVADNGMTASDLGHDGRRNEPVILTVGEIDRVASKSVRSASLKGYCYDAKVSHSVYLFVFC